MHKLGHVVAALPHVNDPGNYMVTDDPAVWLRTRSGRREYFGGHERFTAEQQRRLVEQIREGTWPYGAEE